MSLPTSSIGMQREVCARLTSSGGASLTPQERVRYARHLVIPDLGEEGQRKLKAARVLIVGLGGLGSPASLYLAAAGVGTLGIVDSDTVEISNLQRQILYEEKDIGTPKPKAAAARLAGLNSLVRIEAHAVRFVGGDASRIASGYDVIVDGADNLETRYVMNEVALELGIPYAYGAVFQLEGQAALLCVPGGPCYRCLFPTPPPPESLRPASETGILGVVPGVIGLVQATEVIRWITGYAERGPSRLLLYDARRIEFTSISIDADPACPACGG
jgi:molybdopterin/thiamine biosynthesis adenylyltransferase